MIIVPILICFSSTLSGALISKLVIKIIVSASSSLNRQLYLPYFLCYFMVTIDLKLEAKRLRIDLAVKGRFIVFFLPWNFLDFILNQF